MSLLSKYKQYFFIISYKKIIAYKHYIKYKESIAKDKNNIATDNPVTSMNMYLFQYSYTLHFILPT